MTQKKQIGIMSTLKDMKEILKSLKKTNLKEDAELIAYYEKMIPIWIEKAYNKAINNIGNFNVRKV